MLSDLNPKVNFFSDTASPDIRNRKELKHFIISIFRTERKSLELLNYVFSDDRSLQLINKEYLNHRGLTDIITFRLSGENEPLIGEVYISVDRVRDNAREFGASFKNELHRVIFHGALHLCGFKDKTKSEIRKMREKEGYYLSKYFR